MPAELLSAQQALDEWINSVNSMLNNRYYVFAMLTFCVMLYANLWAFAPTLKLNPADYEPDHDHDEPNIA